MSKYEKFSKEELLALVEKQDTELGSKKYGLVWDSEREPEQVVLDCEHNLPVLRRVKGREIKEPENNDLEDNILIEGDNYHALTVLNYTHQEKIDVIYIDPPYNTGKANEWKYNDKYIDENDGYKHSKWLNMMEKRLRLSKDLLSENGLIFISIDDHEQPQLRMLCNAIFGEENFESFVWKKKGGAGNTEKILGNLTEYILCYFKKKKPGSLNYRNIERKYKHNDSKGPFNLEGIEKTNLGTYERLTMRFPFIDPKTKKKFFPGENMRWTIGEVGAKKAIKNGKIFFDYKKNKVYIIKRPEDYEESENVFYSLLTDLGSLSTAKDELYDFFGNREIFDTPKPTNLIIHLLEISSKENYTVLDFFAGSGTTGQAVLELNKVIKGSKRNFILCTNNDMGESDKNNFKNKYNLSESEMVEYQSSNKKEWIEWKEKYGICSSVTYPRLQKVIKGYKRHSDGEKMGGSGGNLQYFKTDLIRQTKNKDQMRLDLTQKCTEMLCVKENIFNLYIDKEDFKIFSSNKGDKFLCVYYNLLDESFGVFLKDVKKLKGQKKIYMFSIDGRVDRKLFKSINDCDIEEIPQKIVEVYKQLVKMNIPVKTDTIFLEFEKANRKIFIEKEKDESARILRIVLEKTIQKIAQKNSVSIFKDNHKEEKIAVLNDKLKENKVFKQVQWEENKTYLTIGNNASHGDYGEYNLVQVENFYKYIQSLFNDFGI